MKIKLYALLASAALIAPAQAGDHRGSGFVGGGGHISSPSRGAAPSFHSVPQANFGGGRMIYSGQRFSSVGLRSPSSAAFRPHYVNSNGGASIGTRQFTAATVNRGGQFERFSNGGNRGIANPRREGNGAAQVRNGTNLPANWRNHVVAEHSGNWHRDWDRGREHWWHGHRCHFVNGSWFIFDFGFPWYPYGYPYDYYGYDYYPYEYDPGVYEGGADYYGQGVYDSSEQYAGSTVAAAQEQLAREGYYRGPIDGIFGPETRHAITRYQSDHGLRVTGALTTDTLHSLGLRRS